MVWLQSLSSLIKVEEGASPFRGGYLGYGRECFKEVNIGNQSKLL
jgi:hypothetical protein